MIAVELAIALLLPTVVFKGDSQLVITGDYKATEATLATYKKLALDKVYFFNDVEFVHVPRGLNSEANAMAQLAASLEFPKTQVNKDSRSSIVICPKGRSVCLMKGKSLTLRCFQRIG